MRYLTYLFVLCLLAFAYSSEAKACNGAVSAFAFQQPAVVVQQPFFVQQQPVFLTGGVGFGAVGAGGINNINIERRGLFGRLRERTQVQQIGGGAGVNNANISRRGRR